MDILDRLRAALAGRYRVERELGRGGMAIVCLAQDEKHGRPVAIKVLRPELAAAMGSARFLREIEIAAQLNHPNILALHDSGEADGLLYFVMPFLEGESLRTRLNREARLPIDEALRIVSEVGSALSYAHGRGLVHRDVKPENILFQAGHAVVADLGIAKAVSEASDGMTQTGFAVGTFAYMSPEQAAGDAAVDARTDVYALGCVLYEMLAGHVPFSASRPQALLAKKLAGTPHAPLPPDVPAGVAEVVERTLAASPDDRLQTAEELARALDYAATEVGRAEAVHRRRRARLVEWSAGLGTLAVAVLALSWLGSLVSGPRYERLAVLPLASRPGSGPAEAAYVLQGVHEDLIHELGRAGLRVISPSSMQRLAGTDRSIPEIAADLGVDAVVEGTVRREPGGVVVDLRLTDPRSQEVVWTEAFTSTGGLQPLVRAMARAVASGAGLDLSSEAEARLASTDELPPGVYDALLQARFEWNRLTGEGLDAAERSYRSILERDSTVVQAWVGLARVWGGRAQQGLVAPVVAALHADSAIERASTLDPQLGQDHAYLAVRDTWFLWQKHAWSQAGTAFELALEENPTDALTRAYYALYLLFVGRPDEATAQIERAVRDNPFDILVQGLYGQVLNSLHRPEDAVTALRAALQRDSDAPILLTTLRTSYHLLDRHEEAMEMWRASYAAARFAEERAALEGGYERGGYREALRAVADLMVERSSSQRVRYWSIGTLYARAGLAEEALDHLEPACAEGDPNCPYLSVDPIFDPLRDEPRFRALVERLGLPAT